VWADVCNVASHVEWMEDAEEILLTSSSTEGVGTTFTCRTKVGPFRLTDRLEVTEWEPERCIGIHHRGAVGGTGMFRLGRRLRGGTTFVWQERLAFPWWMGGPIGAFVGARVLKRIWRRNLANLRARFT
jgi:hypothetical protein